jgi:hypothetical protein
LLCLYFNIILLQEHWLLEQFLSKLNSIHPNFMPFGISAMSKKASEGILNNNNNNNNRTICIAP